MERLTCGCSIQSTSSSAAVPVYLIQCSSSSLPHPVSNSSLLHPVLQFQSTSSSALVPCSVLHPVLQFQSTSSSLQFQSASSSAPVPSYLIQCSSSSLPHPVLQFQSVSPVQKTLISCSLFLFLLSNFTFFE